jgi:hypothetical protein
LIIAYTYLASAPDVTVVIQYSSDGINWSVAHNSTYTAGSAPVWHYINGFAGSTKLRVVITSNNGSSVKLSSIRALSTRWGDQGQGSELAYPLRVGRSYEYDGVRFYT